MKYDRTDERKKKIYKWKIIYRFRSIISSEIIPIDSN